MNFDPWPVDPCISYPPQMDFWEWFLGFFN